MKNTAITVLVLALSIVLTTSALAQPVNTLSDQEKADGWSLLFDGKTLDGWTTSGDMSAWTVAQDKDGPVITMAHPGNGWWLRTTRMYRDFELLVDFDVAKGMNSGVGLRGSSCGDPAFTGMEIQVFGNQGEKPTITSCGSVYDAITPTAMPLKDGGQWNTFRIKLVGDTLSIWMNGEQIHKDQKLDGRGYTHKVEDKNPLNTRCPTGFIALQDHGDKVRFRNIKIKDLSVDKDPGGFAHIFNGKDTKGWTTKVSGKEGAGKWRIEDGVLVGNDVGLATETSYADFELRAFVMSKEGARGTVLVQSEHQGAELLSLPGAGAWRDCRVRFTHGHVQTWINGKAQADTDATLKSGQVGLWTQGGDVMFKDVQVRDLSSKGPAATGK